MVIKTGHRIQGVYEKKVLSQVVEAMKVVGLGMEMSTRLERLD